MEETHAYQIIHFDWHYYEDLTDQINEYCRNPVMRLHSFIDFMKPSGNGKKTGKMHTSTVLFEMTLR